MNKQYLREFVGKKVKLTILFEGSNPMFYSGYIKNVDDDGTVVFLDKLNKLVVVNSEYVKKIEEVQEGEEDG